MYYTSTNREELVTYNEVVNIGEGYSGTTTTWAEVIDHPNGADYAILKHPKYDAELTELETLTSDWFPEPVE